MVPHLRTALKGAISDLELKMMDATPMIERWFRMEWQEHTPPFYSSVDVRNSGIKFAPIDTNLFPGSFNHLAEELYPLATQAAMAAVEKYCPDAKNLLLIPEDSRQNQRYLQNVDHLAKVLRLTGLNVRLGSTSPEITEPTAVDVGNGQSLIFEPLHFNGRRLTLDNGQFDPCTILLNDDLSNGVPEILRNIHEQILLPPLHAGWTTRRKSTHFSIYDAVVKRFAKFLDIDPWLINALHAKVSDVDFSNPDFVNGLAQTAEAMLKKIAKKYKEYGISDKPFLMLKPDAGTKGIGVTTIYSADDIRELSNKNCGASCLLKNGLAAADILLQEGVPTIETVRSSSAEPVVYMIDRYVVGGFYRSNEQRGLDENLNSTGMQFTPMPFVKQSERSLSDLNTAHNRFYSYGVIGRLAMLAASLELEQTDPNPDFL